MARAHRVQPALRVLMAAQTAVLLETAEPRRGYVIE